MQNKGSESDDYVVVVNDARQYSIWLANQQPPEGWMQVGTRGARSTCLATINELWTQVCPSGANTKGRACGDVEGSETAAETSALRARNVVRLFAERAACTPDAIAIVHGDARTTYRELDERSNQLARYLLGMHLPNEARVGLCLPRSIDMVVTMVGIVKAGCCYVPLDPSYPEARLRYMAADGALSLLITNTRLSQRFVTLEQTGVMCLDSERFSIEACSSQSVSAAIAPEALIYVIYTSGSTGVPKGSMITHEGFHNLISWYVNQYAFGPRDGTLVATAISFDLTQKNVWAPLAVGATVILPPTDEFDPQLVLEAIARTGATTINCTPSLFYLLVENEKSWPLLSSLRVVFLGGEKIESERITPWFLSADCKAGLVNMYGPTECTDIATAIELDKPLPKVIPIGRAIPNVHLRVLDHDLRRVPLGVAGELYICGKGVARGYLHKPALTAERFLPDPFSGTLGARMYKTGDIVHSTADGTHVFHGRADNQVKIRGVRIEPGEIESALLTIESIAAAAVLPLEGRLGPTLVAFIVPAKKGNELTNVDRGAIRQRLRKQLPSHMVPASIIVLESLPLNANGKVDRHLLASRSF
jgi:amino acid adenylation domain-containing protein